MSEKQSADARFLLRRGWTWVRRDRKGLMGREFWANPDGGIYTQVAAVRVERTRGDLGIMVPPSKVKKDVDKAKKTA